MSETFSTIRGTRKIKDLHERADGAEIFHDVPLQNVPASQQPQTEVLAGPPGERALQELGRPCEWCCTEARTIWIAICSWRQNEHILRSRRTRAAPACSPCTDMSTTGLSTETGLTKRKRNLVEPGGGGGGADQCVTRGSLSCHAHYCT